MSVEQEVKRGFDEVRPLFQKLRGLELIIVGGQVVNFWAAQFLQAAPELSLFSPFASKDLDFIGDQYLAEAIHQRLGGSLVRPPKRAPMSLVARIMVKDGDTVLPVDVMRDLRGVARDEIEAMKVPVTMELAPGDDLDVWLLHPLLSMKSRIHNVVEISEKYDNVAGLNQLKASIVCAREYVAHVLSASIDKKGVKAALDYNEWIFRFCMDDGCARAIYRNKGIDPARALVLSHPKLPANFLEHRWPRMKAELDRR